MSDGFLHGIWVILPPWIWAVVITALGRWGEGRLSRLLSRDRVPIADAPGNPWWSVLITNLVFLSLLPTLVLSFFQFMLPFEGARAGLAVGIAAFVFGIAPVRLIDRIEIGWDRTAWRLLVDLLRVGGALMLVGWLVAP
ncbi:MAG: hypothetical protein AB1792_09355 [Candidatus Zixiibacteriota bacterium]